MQPSALGVVRVQFESFGPQLSAAELVAQESAGFINTTGLALGFIVLIAAAITLRLRPFTNASS